MPPLSRFQKSCLALAIGNSFSLAAPVQAETITVTGQGMADCTLIDAITSANNDTAEGNCAQGDVGLDTIVLPGSTLSYESATSFTTALPLVTSQIVLQGAANGSSIIERSAMAMTDFRLLEVYDGGNLTIESVTLQGGAAE